MADAAPSAAEERLLNSSHIPIAQLTPLLSDPSTVPSSIKAVVTLIWPYSSIKNSLTVGLAEPDFRLRRDRGQLRVHFSGSSARSLSTTRVGSGDEVVLSLQGAEWLRPETSGSILGQSLEYELQYSERLLLQIRNTLTGSTSLLDIDHPIHPSIISSLPTPDPELENYVAVESRSRTVPIKEQEEFASPAFIKRARYSYGALLDPEFTDFEDEDGYVEGRGRKRARLSSNSRQWIYNSRSPSPEDAVEEVAAEPPVPQAVVMVDEGCQTDVDLEESFMRHSFMNSTTRTSDMGGRPDYPDDIAEISRPRYDITMTYDEDYDAATPLHTASDIGIPGQATDTTTDPHSLGGSFLHTGYEAMDGLQMIAEAAAGQEYNDRHEEIQDFRGITAGDEADQGYDISDDILTLDDPDRKRFYANTSNTPSQTSHKASQYARFSSQGSRHQSDNKPPTPEEAAQAIPQDVLETQSSSFAANDNIDPALHHNIDSGTRTDVPMRNAESITESGGRSFSANQEQTTQAKLASQAVPIPAGWGADVLNSFLPQASTPPSKRTSTNKSSTERTKLVDQRPHTTGFASVNNRKAVFGTEEIQTEIRPLQYQQQEKEAVTGSDTSEESASMTDERALVADGLYTDTYTAPSHEAMSHADAEQAQQDIESGSQRGQIVGQEGESEVEPYEEQNAEQYEDQLGEQEEEQRSNDGDESGEEATGMYRVSYRPDEDEMSQDCSDADDYYDNLEPETRYPPGFIPSDYGARREDGFENGEDHNIFAEEDSYDDEPSEDEPPQVLQPRGSPEVIDLLSDSDDDAPVQPALQNPPKSPVSEDESRQLQESLNVARGQGEVHHTEITLDQVSRDSGADRVENSRMDWRTSQSQSDSGMEEAHSEESEGSDEEDNEGSDEHVDEAVLEDVRTAREPSDKPALTKEYINSDEDISDDDSVSTAVSLAMRKPSNEHQSVNHSEGGSQTPPAHENEPNDEIFSPSGDKSPDVMDALKRELVNQEQRSRPASITPMPEEERTATSPIQVTDDSTMANRIDDGSGRSIQDQTWTQGTPIKFGGPAVETVADREVVIEPNAVDVESALSVHEADKPLLSTEVVTELAARSSTPPQADVDMLEASAYADTAFPRLLPSVEKSAKFDQQDYEDEQSEASIQTQDEMASIIPVDELNDVLPPHTPREILIRKSMTPRSMRSSSQNHLVSDGAGDVEAFHEEQLVMSDVEMDNGYPLSVKGSRTRKSLSRSRSNAEESRDKGVNNDEATDPQSSQQVILNRTDAATTMKDLDGTDETSTEMANVLDSKTEHESIVGEAQIDLLSGLPQARSRTPDELETIPTALSMGTEQIIADPSIVAEHEETVETIESEAVPMNFFEHGVTSPADEGALEKPEIPLVVDASRTVSDEAMQTSSEEESDEDEEASILAQLSMSVVEDHVNDDLDEEIEEANDMDEDEDEDSFIAAQLGMTSSSQVQDLRQKATDSIDDDGAVIQHYPSEAAPLTPSPAALLERPDELSTEAGTEHDGVISEALSYKDSLSEEVITDALPSSVANNLSTGPDEDDDVQVQDEDDIMPVSREVIAAALPPLITKDKSVGVDERNDVHVPDEDDIMPVHVSKTRDEPSRLSIDPKESVQQASRSRIKSPLIMDEDDIMPTRVRSPLSRTTRSHGPAEFNKDGFISSEEAIALHDPPMSNTSVTLEEDDIMPIKVIRNQPVRNTRSHTRAMSMEPTPVVFSHSATKDPAMVDKQAEIRAQKPSRSTRSAVQSIPNHSPDPETSPLPMRRVSRLRSASLVVDTPQKGPIPTGNSPNPKSPSQNPLAQKLNKELKNSLPSFTPLKMMRFSKSKKADILAIVTHDTEEPQRAPKGPRHYQLKLSIVDSSIVAHAPHEVQIFRPHRDALPVARNGDAILLRHFEVRTERHKIAFRSGDDSSWVVFPQEGEVQIRGPPVEFGKVEEEFAKGLREWWDGVGQ